MMTAGKARIEGEILGIQIMRALAALVVAFHHALESSVKARSLPHSPEWFTTFGAAGVDIFFVISGFIMLYVSFPADRAPIGPGKFLFRRATRIYPLYWLCAGGFVLLSLVGLLNAGQFSPLDIAASAILWPIPNTVLGVSWTLSYELYFYLIFALSLFCRSRRVTTIVVPATIILFFLAGPALPDSWLQKFVSDPISLEFCFGLLLALAYRRGWLPAIQMKWSILGFIALAVAPIFVWHETTGGLPSWPRLFAWGVPSLFIVATCLNFRGPTNWIVRSAVMLGNASYAIYLTHPYVMGVYARLIGKTFIGDVPQYYVVPIIVVCCAILGVLTHLLVEKPLLSLIRQLTHRKLGHVPPVPA